VARASLEELRLDYEDFLRQRNLPFWEPSHPILLRFKQRRCGTLSDFQEWIRTEREIADKPGSDATLAANGILSLLNLTTHLLDRQVKQLGIEFERQGGFTERLYQFRKGKKNTDGKENTD
jgi:four helix bundle suffix protein